MKWINVLFLNLLFVISSNGSAAVTKSDTKLMADDVFSACQYQGLFYSLAAIKAMTGVDNGDVEKYGRAIMMKENEINKFVGYLKNNQDEAMLYRGGDFSSNFTQVCMLNPKKYVATYSRIFN